MNELRTDLPRTVLAILFLVLLIGASLWILSPFLVAIVWATLIAVATWPLLLSLQRLLRGKRNLAVAVLTIALLGIGHGAAPRRIGGVVRNVDNIAGFCAEAVDAPIPARAGLAGEDSSGRCEGGGHLESRGGDRPPALLKEASPYFSGGVRWFTERIGNRHGPPRAVPTDGHHHGRDVLVRRERRRGRQGVLPAAGRPKGVASVELAGGAIRAVAMGVIVTAVAQSLLAASAS